MKPKIRKIKEIACKKLNSCSAHEIDHVTRVCNICLHLAKGENVNLEVLQAAALLHDIGGLKEINDPSGKTDHAVVGAEIAGPILKKVGFSEKEIEHIQGCIRSHRYKTENKPQTKEAQILFDADKIDTLGALGIARAYVWIGRNRGRIYARPNIKKYIKGNMDGKINGRIKDKTKHSPQIEFEVKYKFLKDKLYTKKAKKVAQERTKFMKSFLDRLEKEIKGKL